MIKFLLMLLAVFLSSCFGKNVIVDEDDNFLEKQKNISSNISHGHDANIIEEILDDRKIITRNDEKFTLEDIHSNFREGDASNKAISNKFGHNDFNYQLSGLSKDSSKLARERVENFKNSNKDIVFVVYFDFDSSLIKTENKQIIVDHMNFLQNNPNLKLILHGHTDIKGTREYNLALGERRGFMIKNLINKNNNKITVISFGEEKIASNIAAKNRRVEFIYQ